MSSNLQLKTNKKSENDSVKNQKLRQKYGRNIISNIFLLIIKKVLYENFCKDKIEKMIKI
jgi:hypothetical protein